MRKKIKIVTYDRSHGKEIILREMDRRALFGGDQEEVFAALNSRGELWTCLVDTRVAFIYGVVLLWTGVAELVAATSEIVEQIPDVFTGIVRSYSDAMVEKYRLHRLQAQVFDFNERSMRWAEKRLGFEFEAILKAYGPGREDIYSYRRII